MSADGKPIATVDELSASYGRRLIREELARKRAAEARERENHGHGHQPATPRHHGKRVRNPGTRRIIG